MSDSEKRRFGLRHLSRAGLATALTVGAAAVAIGVAGPAAGTTSTTVPLNPAHVGAENPGFKVGTCPTPPEGQEGWWGWHFIMPGNNNFTSLTVTFEKAGTFTANPFPGTVFVAHPDNSHAYIWTPEEDTLLSGSATSSGSNRFFNLSHVCPGSTDVPREELTVTKTAETSYTREHFWAIAKAVDPTEIWLYTGSGDTTATWTVDVTYEGYEDRDFAVEGTITIENTGDLDAVITGVVDVIQDGSESGIPVTVDCGDAEFPYDLAVGETLECTYSAELDGKVQGANEATVTTGSENAYVGTADLTWGDPATEVNKTVTVTDDSERFGSVDLGTATAPDGATFSYTKGFAWADYGAAGCGDHTYANTATIVETRQSASATLTVHVQCVTYETAFAKASDGRCFLEDGFSRWGWTNPVAGPGTYTWDLWAAAGQCDTAKGTKVGTVTVTYGSGNVTVTYNVNTGVLLKETHVYAGTTKYPKVRQGRKLVDTVAPGQYYVTSPLSGSIWVIAHAVVGVPDPTFGPPMP